MQHDKSIYSEVVFHIVKAYRDQDPYYLLCSEDNSVTAFCY